LTEAWVGAEGLAMIKIADLFGLKMTGLNMSNISPYSFEIENSTN
tara:strand:+ start:708 stop:842 length:135 start_codon:yes stop_codon:yes gene_type:complete